MYPSTPMQYNKYKTILEQVSHPQEATVNTINEPTKSTTTLDYYNKNAKKFITGTISVDFGTIQNRFLDKLHPGAEILDYGCGSGRDIKYFLEQGCKVTAIDGSQELCKLASEYTGIPVKHMLFQDLDEKEVYDGIWACSSILHVPANELRDIIKKMANALRAHGIIYTSFKYGTFEGERNGRYFTDMTEETFREDVTISWKDGLFTLSMGESGRGRKQRFAKVEELSDITIFSDTSAIEIFINNGETVLTTRVYSEHLEQKVELVSREVKGSVHGYELGSFEVEYKK